MDSSQNYSTSAEVHPVQFLNDFQATEEVESWQALINPLAALHNCNDNSVASNTSNATVPGLICDDTSQAIEENIGQTGYDHANENLNDHQNQLDTENEIHANVENSV